MIRDMVTVMVMFRVSGLLWSDYGQGMFKGIARVRVRFGFELGLLCDPNNLLTLTITPELILRPTLCPKPPH